MIGSYDIGIYTDPDLEGSKLAQIDADALIGSHLCIQGNSGAGKSGAIRRILEVTHGKVQQIVLDVEDEFHTLREKFEYVVAGGDSGDCAATVNNSDTLALTILRGGFSAVVQINNLEVSDRREFISRFLNALLKAPKDLWRPLLVVLDEAQMYCPQVGVVESSAAVVSLMTLGRKRGFTGILATPRVSAISKDALSAVNSWLMGRVGQPVDRRSTADALGFKATSAEAHNLKSMPPRTFWSFGRALSEEPRLLMVDQTETTIVKAGQAAIPTPPAPAAMAKILEALNKAAVATEVAGPKVPTTGTGVKLPAGFTAISPGHVRGDGDGLFEKLKKAKAEGDAEGYQRGRAEGHLTGIASGRRHITGILTDALRQLTEEAERLCNLAHDEASAIVIIDPHSSYIDRKDISAADRKMLDSMKALQGNGGKIKPPPTEKPPRAPREAGKIAGAGMALLSALARYPDRGLTWNEAAIVAGQKSGNGHFNTGKKSLVDGGMVREIKPGHFVPAPSSGIAMENHGKLTRAALVALWSARLKSPGPTMLAYFAANSREWVTAEKLAEATGLRSGNGHWNTGLKSLRTSGLVEQDGRAYRLAAFLREAR